MSNGTYDQVAGKIKETAGKAVGDKEIETEGVLQNLQGKATEAVEVAAEAPAAEQA